MRQQGGRSGAMGWHEGSTREKGERSGLRPRPMVASDHTTMKETAPSSRAPKRITQGLATHLYIIRCGCAGLLPADHSQSVKSLDMYKLAWLQTKHNQLGSLHVQACLIADNAQSTRILEWLQTMQHQLES